MYTVYVSDLELENKHECLGSHVICHLMYLSLCCNVQNLHTCKYHNPPPVVAKYFHAHKFSDYKTPQSLPRDLCAVSDPPTRYVLLSMSVPQANITQMTVSQFMQLIQSHIFLCDTFHFLTFSWHFKKKNPQRDSPSSQFIPKSTHQHIEQMFTLLRVLNPI